MASLSPQRSPLLYPSRRRSRVPHWAYAGGPFGRMYRGEWFFFWRPQYGEGWKWGLGHRMGGFYLIELGPVRIGRQFSRGLREGWQP